MPENLLGEYLRARRAQVSPADVGLGSGGRRRVAGLRREEVATLAAISADYYLRLEQGRHRRPSVQVLKAIGQALRLDQAGISHLLALGAGAPRVQHRHDGDSKIPASISALLRALALPAFVHDRHFDVLASNEAARAFSPTMVPGRNRLLDLVLDPGEQALYVDLDQVHAQIVAGFRTSLGEHAADSRSVELLERLCAEVPHFEALWQRYHVAPRVDAPPIRVDHPSIGALTLRRENLNVAGPDGLGIAVFHAEPRTTDGDLLARLVDPTSVDRSTHRRRGPRRGQPSRAVEQGSR